MSLVEMLRIGLMEIKHHKLRSLLTMLGIILGVANLVATAALTKGMENGLKEALVEFGGLEKVRIVEDDIPVKQRHMADQAVGVTIHDAYALQNVPLIELVTPEMRLPRPVITSGGKTARRVYLAGTWPNALEMNEHVIEHGRMFTDVEMQNAHNVCVIGTAVRDQLFGKPEGESSKGSPVGEVLFVNGLPFHVIGMFKHYESERERKSRELNEPDQSRVASQGITRDRGDSSEDEEGDWVFRLKNRTIYIPLDTMWLKFLAAGSETNSIPNPRLFRLNIKVADAELMTPALQQVRNVLTQTHRRVEDFRFQMETDWAEDITTSIQNARLSGGFISAISLLVGGIGIMNILLASITERVREIGIRKAVGATGIAVFVQVLVESMVIACLAGLLGLAASSALVEFLTIVSPSVHTPVIMPEALITGFLVSSGVGLLAGLFPALKAARLDPLDALRYE